MLVFSGNANRQLAEDIVNYLNIPLGKAIVGRFSDGEVMVEIMENVRGKDVFIVQPTCQPTNDNLMELMVMVDAARRIHHHHQFHEVVVGGLTGGLHDEDILAADVLHDLHHHLAVAETSDDGLAQRDIQIIDDVFRELPIGIAGEHLHRVVWHVGSSRLPRLALTRSQNLSIQNGWGARIRTWECWNQNPVPYRLATPQQYARHSLRASAFGRGGARRAAGGRGARGGGSPTQPTRATRE